MGRISLARWMVRPWLQLSETKRPLCAETAVAQGTGGLGGGFGGFVP